ncbi:MULTISPECIES: glycosyltransferase [unclassified Caballeronia]|uniref:glycosyltransferase n=1 Tax=unclassified Caballeronia TaxID=2646786 RepID=UPI00158DE26C|nr:MULTISPECIES: glycosyltransferase [unclassified Caballeronia]QSN60691.1 glycosyltransferase [Caballeronia sp. M1242]
MPLLTIITPCYKTVAYYLERLATSLWPVQSDVQWIVVNDSPEDTAIDAFAQRMASCFEHFEYVRHDRNRGIFAAYTSALVAASAPYAAILDHDDEVDLIPLVQFLKRHRDEYDLVFTDETKFSAETRERYWKPEFDGLSAMHYFYMHHITCFRTSICKEMILAEPDAEARYRSCFDIWLAFGYQRRFADRALKHAHLPYAAYGWRIHPASTAMNLGQKPKAEAERLEIAARLYEPLDAGAAISVDPVARYVVRYEHALSSSESQGELAALLSAHFDAGFAAPDGRRVDVASSVDPGLLNLLARVPVGLLAWHAGERCLVLPRTAVPETSELGRQVARHVRDVPFVAPATTLDGAALDAVFLRRPAVLVRKDSGFALDRSRLNVLVV